MAGLPGHASGQDDDNSGWAGPPVGGTHLGPDLRVNPGIGDMIDPVCVKRTAVSGVGNNCLVNSIRHALLNTIPASVSFLSCGGWLCVRVLCVVILRGPCVPRSFGGTGTRGVQTRRAQTRGAQTHVAQTGTHGLTPRLAFFLCRTFTHAPLLMHPVPTS